jgi:hypothetical protein
MQTRALREESCGATVPPVFYNGGGKKKKDMRYRAGALRGPRSLRDVYTGFAMGLPMVGTKNMIATNGSANRRGIQVTK